MPRRVDHRKGVKETSILKTGLGESGDSPFIPNTNKKKIVRVKLRY